MQAGCLRIVAALRGTRAVRGFDCLQFDDDGCLGHEVDGALADDCAVVGDGDVVLLGDDRAGPRPSPGQAARNSCGNAFAWTFSRNAVPSVFGSWNAATAMRSDGRLVSVSSAYIVVHLRSKILAVVRAGKVLRLGERFWRLVGNI